MSPNMTLSIDSDSEPLKCVKVFSSTLVMLQLANAPACSAVLCAIRYAGFGLTRFTKSCASRISKTAVESASLLCTYISRLAFVNYICILTTLSKCVCKLHISVFNLPTISISLFCFNLSHRAWKPLYVEGATAAVGSHTPRSPVSRYQEALVSCVSAASLP